MLLQRSLVLAVASGVLASLIGCVSTRGHLASSAHALEYHSQLLAQDAGGVPAATGADYPATYARDATALAEAAHELRRAAEGTSDTDVRAAFDRVSRAYHAVRDEVEHSQSLQARSDLTPVTEAYRDVENDLGYPAREASADYRVPEDR
jgi:hypothetical protein